MRRVLLMVAALAVLALVVSPASAENSSVSCGLGPSVHNAATCTAGTLTVDGEPALDVATAIGPVAGAFSGDVTVTLASTSGRIQKACFYRVTGGFGLVSTVCLDSSEGDFSDPLATCSVVGSGVGEFRGTCTIQSAE